MNVNDDVEKSKAKEWPWIPLAVSQGVLDDDEREGLGRVGHQEAEEGGARASEGGTSYSGVNTTK